MNKAETSRAAVRIRRALNARRAQEEIRRRRVPEEFSFAVAKEEQELAAPAIVEGHPVFTVGNFWWASLGGEISVKVERHWCRRHLTVGRKVIVRDPHRRETMIGQVSEIGDDQTSVVIKIDAS